MCANGVYSLPRRLRRLRGRGLQRHRLVRDGLGPGHRRDARELLPARVAIAVLAVVVVDLPLARVLALLQLRPRELRPGLAARLDPLVRDPD